MKGFIKDMAIYLPAQFLPALTAFITTPILTGIFPPKEYSDLALATNIIAFLVAVAVSGYGSAVIRFYPFYKARAALKTFFATLSVSVSGLITVLAGASILVLCLFGSHVPASLSRLMPLVILIFIVQSLFSVFVSVMRAQGRSGSYTAFQLLFGYGSLGLGLFLVLALRFRVEGLLWGALFSIVLILPPLLLRASREAGIHPGAFRWTDAFQMWEYAWPMTLGNVAMWGLRMSDVFIIRAFRSEEEVGLYSVSYNISAKSIELLVALFLLSVSPLVMRTWEEHGREATERTLGMVTRVFLLLCFPAAVGLSVLAFPFVALLTAPDYHEGAKIVGYVVFSSFIWGLSNIALMGMAVKRRARRIGTNQIIAASLHIGLQVLLVPRFGYIASAVSTLIGYCVLLALQALGSRPYLVWTFPRRTLRNVIAASAVMGLAVWVIYGLSGARDRASPLFLLLSIAAGGIIYFVGLWVLGETRDEVNKAVSGLRFRTKGKRLG